MNHWFQTVLSEKCDKEQLFVMLKYSVKVCLIKFEKNRNNLSPR